MRTLDQKKEYLKLLEQQRQEFIASVNKLRIERENKIADIRYNYNVQIREINQTKKALENKMRQIKLSMK